MHVLGGSLQKNFYDARVELCLDLVLSNSCRNDTPATFFNPSLLSDSALLLQGTWLFSYPYFSIPVLSCRGLLCRRRRLLATPVPVAPPPRRYFGVRVDFANCHFSGSTPGGEPPLLRLSSAMASCASLPLPPVLGSGTALLPPVECCWNFKGRRSQHAGGVLQRRRFPGWGRGRGRAGGRLMLG